MREIKFRAWDKEKKKMFSLREGTTDSITIFEDGSGYISDFEDDHICDIDFGSLMQYTGLKDKNGKEIYEGDILQETFFGHIRLLIVKFGEFYCNFTGKSIITGFYNENFSFDGKRIESNVHGPTTSYNIYDTTTEIVIGNIYENPELLKGD